MKKLSVILALCVTIVVLMAAPALAVGPVDNPGGGPPTLDRVTFINYPEDLPVKGGTVKPPKDTTTKDWYKYSGIHWDTTSLPVEYVVNLSGSTDDGTFLSGINAAFNVWEADEQSSVDFNYIGSFTSIPSSFSSTGSSNGINEVGWVDISQSYPNAIAVTMVWYNSLTKEIVEIDMAMNSALPWTQNIVSGDPDNSEGTAGYFDVQNIATHEVGHWLMLGDLYNKPTTSQTMYGYGSTGEVSKRSLESGDLAGLRLIYP
jgi:hypothetical protein